MPTVLKYQDTNENTLTQEEDSNTPLHPTKKQKQKQTNNKQPKNKQSKAKQNKNIKQETKNPKNYNKNNNKKTTTKKTKTKTGRAKAIQNMTRLGHTCMDYHDKTSHAWAIHV